MILELKSKDVLCMVGFFNELLDEKTINKIPDVMILAQRKFREEISLKNKIKRTP